MKKIKEVEIMMMKREFSSLKTKMPAHRHPKRHQVMVGRKRRGNGPCSLVAMRRLMT